MKIRIAGIANDSIVDGIGLRFTVFTQGCPHHCKGCHNPQTHDFNGGREVETKEIIRQFRENSLLDGITFSGGEPFCQPEACTEIARSAHDAGLNVWCYTGYTIEQLEDMPKAQCLLNEVDILVDGKFILKQRTLELPWRGSKNQRIIDMKKSRGI